MSSAARILVVDDEASLRQMMEVLLRRAGHEVAVASGVREAADILRTAPTPYDMVITDLMMADGTGLDVIDHARAITSDTQVIVVTAHGSVETAVEAMRRGAYGYLEKPLSIAAARAIVEKALEKRELLRTNAALRVIAKTVQPDVGSGSLIGRSPSFNTAMQLARKMAPSKASVLITGQTGTGKELFARAIHNWSDRNEKPFLVVNCGAIPENLMESELFGHEKGSFSSATSKHDGVFKKADTGTLFLDEVGELPLQLQVKLLRALQERKIRTVGGTMEFSVDVRIVAATNRDLAQMVKEKTFREDLYFRLNVLRVHLPPLSERKEDLEALIEHFRLKFAEEQGRPNLTFSPDALRALLNHAWPGNVRELENSIERAVTLATPPNIHVDDLPPEVLGSAANMGNLSTVMLPDQGINLEATLERVERSLIRQALERSGGVRTQASKLLGLTFRSLRYRLQKLGMAENSENDSDTDA
jgi:two-component system, NtrC family, response regulator PilR